MSGRGARGRWRPLISLLVSIPILLAATAGTMAGSIVAGSPSSGPRGSQAPVGPSAEDEAPLDLVVRPPVPAPVARDRRRPEPPAASLIVYVPHQDDELLSVGVVLARHLRAGDRVVVVVLTDGSASSARGGVNAALAALHVPPLTPADLAHARDRELLAALAVLGIPAADVLRIGLRDGSLTADEAWAAIRPIVARHPRALHVGTSTLDGHPDHIALGLALSRAAASGVATAWAVARPAWKAGAAAGCRSVQDPAVERLLALAAGEYRRWDPAEGRYAIAGRYSVPGLFDALVRDPRVLLCDRPG